MKKQNIKKEFDTRFKRLEVGQEKVNQKSTEKLQNLHEEVQSLNKHKEQVLFEVTSVSQRLAIKNSLFQKQRKLNGVNQHL